MPGLTSARAATRFMVSRAYPSRARQRIVARTICSRRSGPMPSLGVKRRLSLRSFLVGRPIILRARLCSETAHRSRGSVGGSREAGRSVSGAAHRPRLLVPGPLQVVLELVPRHAGTGPAWYGAFPRRGRPSGRHALGEGNRGATGPGPERTAGIQSKINALADRRGDEPPPAATGAPATSREPWGRRHGVAAPPGAGGLSPRRASAPPRAPRPGARPRR